MRSFPLLLALALSSVAATASAADAQRAATVNARISPPTKEIALNQPLRIDFVTMPRQVENVDIAAAVANAITLSGGTSWRLLGKPTVSEHEKTHTVSISISLLPREPGKKVLPQIPLTWLQGDSYAEFGEAKIADKIAVGSDDQPQPKECAGVAGFAWSSKLADLKTTRIPDNLISFEGERTVARPQPGLELIFRNGELAEATVAAPGLTLDQARDSFFSRWGLPQLEDTGSITWILGWTRIVATQTAGDQPGVRLVLTREDIEARQAQARVKGAVFDVLEGPQQQPQAQQLPQAPPETEEQAKARQRKEAEEFLKQQAAARTGAVDQAAPAPKPEAPKAPEAPKP